MARSRFAAVDLVDSFWRRLAFTQREDETKISLDDVPLSSYWASVHFKIVEGENHRCCVRIVGDNMQF